MDMDVTHTAAAVMPFVTAAVQTYGAMTLEKLRDGVIDGASGASADWGRRLLLRILGKGETQAGIEGAVEELAAEPQDEDAVAALRLQIRRALASDPSLQADVSRILVDASSATSQVSTDFRVTQSAASFGSSQQAVLGNGTQNVQFK
ncbi:hypothetical protein [Micromonospora chersina]|uniref:hypothetical protein n=1 Tax=Micromonospora chersina TaxID=47854 RepID=UPI0037118048